MMNTSPESVADHAVPDMAWVQLAAGVVIVRVVVLPTRVVLYTSIACSPVTIVRAGLKVGLAAVAPEFCCAVSLKTVP